MKKLFFYSISFILCSCFNNEDLHTVEKIQFLKDKETTILGDETKGKLVTEIGKIDSILLTSIPENYPEFDLELNENQLIAKVFTVGDHPYSAEIFSNGKTYNLLDTIKVRPPSMTVSSRFGFYLVSNMNNLILANVNGFLKEEIVVESDRGELTKKDDGLYILDPLDEGPLNITVSIYANGAKRVVGKQQMLVVDQNTTFNQLITLANTK